MKSSLPLWGHAAHASGWGMVAAFFLLLPSLGKPAFLLLAISSILFGVALVMYNAPGVQRHHNAEKSGR